MPTGKPATTCAARSKQTGKPCKNSPIPGGTVCRFHGGGSKKARAAGLRQLEENRIRARLTVLKAEEARHESIADAAYAQWAHDERLLLMNWAEPRDLREVARELRLKSTELFAKAREIERQTRAARWRAVEAEQSRMEREEEESADGG